MKLKMKRRKRFSYEFPLKGHSERGFILRITECRVDIESLDKEWKVMFSSETYEYAFITEALKQEAFNDLYFRAVAIFGSRLVFRDSKMVQGIYQLMENVSKNILPPKSDQSDEEILAEEKFMHEKDQESFDELQNIRDEKKSEGEDPPKASSQIQPQSKARMKVKKSTKSSQNEQK